MLQARIMAAQERAKQAQGGTTAAAPAPPPQAPAADLLSGGPPPPPIDSLPPPSMPPPPAACSAPPPPFDDSLLPPQAPPPAFNDSLLPPQTAPPPSATSTAPSLQWDPHAVASAPDYGDILACEAPLPSPVAPPRSTLDPPPAYENTRSESEQAIDAILGMEGLSEAEKQQLLAEQTKIMASIEQNKKTAHLSAADAFDRRALANSVQSVSVGGGRTAHLRGSASSELAVRDGTAISVQCLSCDHWVQVTPNAELLNCPACHTVQPVVIPDHPPPSGVAAAMGGKPQEISDAELAEQLQKEEYENNRSAQERAKHKKQQQAATASEGDGSWMSWLGLSSSSAAPVPAPEPKRSYTAPTPPPGGLYTADVASTPRLPRNNDFQKEEEPQPLLSYVADSLESVYNSTVGAPEAPRDVDSSSLLAMPNVSRNGGRAESQTEYENY